MFRLACVMAVALIAMPVFAAPSLGSFHAVVNIDVLPSDEAAGMEIVTRFVRNARQDPAILSVSLIQQSGTPNHFILEESFADPAAYRRFIQSPAFRDFRTALYPHLGSPWDERLGGEIAQ